MDLKEMIYRRKSVRSFTGEPVDHETIEKIKAFGTELKPLYPNIKVHWDIVGKEAVKCILPWITPQLIAIYSEEPKGYLENVGFIFQQLDLYLQSIGLGVCWLGMGRMSSDAVAGSASADNASFVIMLAFGYPKGEARRSSAKEFKRKNLSEIADRYDERLEPARLAPSSVNSQPWYFTHDSEKIHVYCVQQGFLKAKTIGYMNQIDIGIALAHMYVENTASFEMLAAEQAAALKGYTYICSFKI